MRAGVVQIKARIRIWQMKKKQRPVKFFLPKKIPVRVTQKNQKLQAKVIYTNNCILFVPDSVFFSFCILKH